MNYFRIIPAVILPALFALPASGTSIRWPAQSVELNVQFDTTAHSVSGVARISLPVKGSRSLGFLLNKNFTVQSATANGKPLELKISTDYDTTEVTACYGAYGKWDAAKAAFYYTKIPKKVLRNKKQLILEVAFTGKLYAPPDTRQFSREKIAFEVDGTIGKEGIYLSDGAFWYPKLPDCQTPYTITARLPKGWKCVTDGAAAAPRDTGAFVQITHTAEFPVVGVSLSAGPYVVKSVQQDGVVLSTYFLPAETALADGYLDACKKFIATYSKLIGPYPFPKFAVVDNFLPSGYGLPGWTLLGSEVIRLPFIKDISLGHEILHNWFGNSLLVDYRGGNWCEGLTTYLADYKYKADADSQAALEYRTGLLREFGDYVNAENDYPVGKFSERSNQADRAIGYGKVMMIFHMLRAMLDQQDTTLFTKMMQQVYKEYKGKPVSWLVWRQQSERRLGQRLDWFFEQWVEQPGAPRIRLENGVVEHYRGGWSAQVEVVTEPSEPVTYNYFLPFRCVSDEGHIDMTVFIREPRQKVILGPGLGNLEFVRADPASDLFRVLYPEEAPLTLGAFFGDKEGVMVVPAKGARAAAYRTAAEGLRSEGQTVVTDSAFTPALAGRSLWIFGTPEENSVWAKFPPDPERLGFLPGRAARWKEEQPIPPALTFRREELRGGAWTATMILMHPKAPGKSIVYSASLPAADPIAGTRKLPHYGKYSYLLFDGDANTQKGAWAAGGKSPMVWEAPPLTEEEAGDR